MTPVACAPFPPRPDVTIPAFALLSGDTLRAGEAFDPSVRAGDRA